MSQHDDDREILRTIQVPRCAPSGAGTIRERLEFIAAQLRLSTSERSNRGVRLSALAAELDQLAAEAASPLPGDGSQ